MKSMRQLRTVQLLALTLTALPATFWMVKPSSVAPLAFITTIDPALAWGKKLPVPSGWGSLPWLLNSPSW